MKAKCPHCETGCEKCTDGKIEVRFAEGTIFTKVCTNRETCGFVNGGYISETYPSVASGPCHMCGEATDWMLMSEAPEEENWQKPENKFKFAYDKSQKMVESLRGSNKDLRQLALRILEGQKEFTLDECRLMKICRICHKPESVPFMYNYGEEYAHSKCLDKEKEDGSRVGRDS